MFREHGGYVGIAGEIAASRGGKLGLKLGAFLRGEPGRRSGESAHALRDLKRNQVLLVRCEYSNGGEQHQAVSKAGSRVNSS